MDTLMLVNLLCWSWRSCLASCSLLCSSSSSRLASCSHITTMQGTVSLQKHTIMFSRLYRKWDRIGLTLKTTQQLYTYSDGLSQFQNTVARCKTAFVTLSPFPVWRSRSRHFLLEPEKNLRLRVRKFHHLFCFCKLSGLKTFLIIFSFRV